MFYIKVVHPTGASTTAPVSLLTTQAYETRIQICCVVVLLGETSRTANERAHFRRNTENTFKDAKHKKR